MPHHNYVKKKLNPIWSRFYFCCRAYNTSILENYARVYFLTRFSFPKIMLLFISIEDKFKKYFKSIVASMLLLTLEGFKAAKNIQKKQNKKKTC